MSKKIYDLHIELTKDEYAKLQGLISSGKYRTKISIIREALRLVFDNCKIS